MRVGIIGTGAIGLPIAEQIIKNGFELAFYARRDAVISQLQDYGAVYCEKAEMGKLCNIVLLAVSTYEQCKECLDELLKTMRGGIVVIHSTISPEQTVLLSIQCRGKKVTLLSVPVTGGATNAKAGKLTAIVGGEQASFELVKPVLQCYSEIIIYTGGSVETAATIKLLIQLLVGIHCVAAAEVIALGEKCDLDLGLLYEAVCNSAGSSKMFEKRAKLMIDRNFSAQAAIEILYKDMKLGMELSNAAKCTLPVSQSAFNIFQVGLNTLEDSTEDICALLKVYETGQSSVS